MARVGSWPRRYPPLITVILALALAIFALPSALNVSQPNPGQTLEYAPVPGNNGSAPPGGNLAALGLGAGNSGAGGALQPPPAPQLSNAGANPSTKRCVGTPPRQTEDPLSPPCVAYFNGDNGGATHDGVTSREIRVLYYFDGGAAGGTSNSDDKHPVDSYWDLSAAPSSSDPVFIRMLRDYQVYFNTRYQTYGRTVHITVHFGSVDTTQTNATAASRGADAAEDLSKVHPYAVVAAVSGYLADYTRVMMEHGVTVFLGNPEAGVFGAGMQSASFYSSNPGLMWSFFPSVDELAALYTSYLCSKVVSNSVYFSANPGEDGKARVFGIWKSSDQAHPDLIRFGDLIQRGVEACGGSFKVVGNNPVNNGDDTRNGPCPSESSTWAQFKQQQVTTIVWTAGYTDPCELTFAQSIDYFPELMMTGDGLMDTNLAGQLEGPAAEMTDARIITTYTAVANVAQQPCTQAAWEVDPQAAEQDLQSYGCAFYADLRELFTGIQVAGPHLDPAHVDQGYHAIPAVASTDPRVPACFYQHGDYTCVKDAQVEWWDPSGRADPRQNPGCWRMMQVGKRYLAGTWPSGNVDAQKGSTDPCNDVGISPT